MQILTTSFFILPAFLSIFELLLNNILSNMKKYFLVYSVITILFLFSNHNVNAQVIRPFIADQEVSLRSIQLSPFIGSSDLSTSNKGYAMEFLAYELGYLGGSAITAGLFIGGFIAVWGGNGYLGAPFLITSLVTAIGTPVFAAYTMSLFGRKHHSDGKFGTAVWGSYLGIGVTAGVSLLGSYLVTSTTDYNDGNRNLYGFYNALNTTALIILPGIIAVSIYNIFPKAKTEEIGNALFNGNGGKFTPGIPALSISPNPFDPGTHFTQLKFLSVSL